MANTIITKNSSTASAVPTSGDLVQGELAVNVTDKRLFTENSGGTVVEVGTNPSTIAVAGNATVGGTLGVTGLATLASSTLTANPTLSAGTANGVTYLNGSKVLTSGSSLTFDGSQFSVLSGSPGTIASFNGRSFDTALLVTGSGSGGNTIGDSLNYSAITFNPNDSTQRYLVSGSEAMRLTSTGLGIGTSSPAQTLHVKTSTSATPITLGVLSNATGLPALSFNGAYASTTMAGIYGNGATASSLYYQVPSGQSHYFGIADVTKMTIDSSGNVGIGNVSPSVKLDLTSGTPGETANSIRLGYGRPANPTDAIHQIQVSSDNFYIKADTANTIASNIIFDNDGSEKMRIDSSGNLLVGKTTSATTTRGFVVDAVGEVACAQPNTGIAIGFYYTVTGSRVGSITVGTSSTSYNTSSDYRLKEDWVAVADASTRVNALNPVNFAWKVDGSRVDGFLAHEVAEVVPEAVTGEKDAVDAEGKPVYQGIDQSKLVPLLTAALQEALAEINSLKARLDAANL